MQIDKDIAKLANIFKAEINSVAFNEFQKMQKLEASISKDDLKKQFGLKRKPQSSLFKECDEDQRIYPGYFAPVMILIGGKRCLVPMRYRVRPKGSRVEIPSKFNVFNARVDSLEARQTWQSLFLRNHGLFPFKKFFEWVEDENGSKQLINFSPKNHEIMWAPCLWDLWQSPDGTFKFYSFAVITTDPPSEVLAQGHDRCPIFLKSENIDDWLSLLNKDPAYYKDLLSQLEPCVFDHKLIA